MTNFLFFVVGFLICWLIMQKPLQIKVIQAQDTPKTTLTKQEIKDFEKEMFKENAEEDNNYKNLESELDKIMQEVNETMGGSDR